MIFKLLLYLINQGNEPTKIILNNISINEMQTTLIRIQDLQIAVNTNNGVRILIWKTTNLLNLFETGL